MTSWRMSKGEKDGKATGAEGVSRSDIGINFGINGMNGHRLSIDLDGDDVRVNVMNYIYLVVCWQLVSLTEEVHGWVFLFNGKATEEEEI